MTLTATVAGSATGERRLRSTATERERPHIIHITVWVYSSTIAVGGLRLSLASSILTIMRNCATEKSATIASKKRTTVYALTYL
jgi:hypothetical protein